MTQRLDHIDGLRGLAALLVLYQHLAEYGAAMAPAASFAESHLRFLFGYLDVGKLGVVMFFAISGYIVPFSFRSDYPRSGFVISRLFRLYPAYWLSLLAAAALLPQLGHAEFSPRQVAANATMVQGLLHQKDAIGVYWTLLVEVIFYAMCFAVFSIGRLRSARTALSIFGTMLALAIASAYARSEGHTALPVALPLYLAVMWFAHCTRLATLEHDGRARQLCWVMLPVLLAMVPWIWATAYDDSSHKENVLADVSAFYAALLLFLVCVKTHAFSSTLLVYLGGISYSIYLFHPLALELGASVGKGFAWPAGALVQIGVTLVLSLVTADLVHRFVERPAIRLGKRLLPALAGLRRGGIKVPVQR